MTNRTDKERCDALVEAGILVDCGVPESQRGVSTHNLYAIKGDEWYQKSPVYWISDWRVAGKCLESLSGRMLVRIMADIATELPGPLPRAIIDAYLDSLEDRDD